MHGRIYWHELMTDDTQSAKNFYSSIFGWGYEAFPGMGDYSVVNDGKSPTAGILGRADNVTMPAHWLFYVQVDDAEATTGLVKEKGGNILMDVRAIPGVGKLAIAADPNGAVFGVITPEQPSPVAEGMPTAGQFCWYNVVTPDLKASVEFYGALFGWTYKSVESAGHVLLHNGKPIGGIAETRPGVPPHVPHWLLSVAVDSVDDTIAKADAASGTLMTPKFAIGKLGWAAILADAAGGAVFSVFEADMEGMGEMMASLQ